MNDVDHTRDTSRGDRRQLKVDSAALFSRRDRDHGRAKRIRGIRMKGCGVHEHVTVIGGRGARLMK